MTLQVFEDTTKVTLPVTTTEVSACTRCGVPIKVRPPEWTFLDFGQRDFPGKRKHPKPPVSESNPWKPVTAFPLCPKCSRDMDFIR